MIQLYSTGIPIETGAVSDELPVTAGVEAIPYFQCIFQDKSNQSDASNVSNQSDASRASNQSDLLNESNVSKENEAKKPLILKRTMSENEQIFGLGESVRGMNKRGWIYESRCMDNCMHTETEVSLYSAHNFILVRGEKIFGLFVDYPGILTFDMGYSKPEEMQIMADDINLKIYLIEGKDVKDIIRQFRKLIGQSYAAPLWAFGYQQSRYSYFTEKEVRQVALEHEKEGWPLESIYLDIDYMERYKDFTYDAAAFGNLPALTHDMKEKEIHLVPIIDAAIKIEKGYDVYESGVEKQYFCTDENGKPFVAGVWPGKVHFPDVLNKEAARWFGGYYKYLMDMGIDGFWNDMNEPAIFYSQENLENVFKKIDAWKEMNLDVTSYFEMQREVTGLINNPGDYKRMYHNMEGKRIRHDKVHNLYGYYMTKAAADAFEKIEPKKRTLIFSRSSCIGMHRYGGIWTGDNHAWWSHMELLLHQLPNLNMCGFLYVGSDVGGFQEDTTEDLMLRWMQLSMFVPLMRNHSDIFSRKQELYRFDHREWFGSLLKIRYRLIPYLYSEYMKAVLSDGMMFEPLSFVFPEDKMTWEIEDQLMVGESIMIAPVMEQNKTGRYVYLPEDMLLIRLSDGEQVKTQKYTKGIHYINYLFSEILFFLRKKHLMILGKPVLRTTQIDFNDLELVGNGLGEITYQLYYDDGYTTELEKEGHIKTVTFNHQI